MLWKIKQKYFFKRSQKSSWGVRATVRLGHRKPRQCQQLQAMVHQTIQSQVKGFWQNKMKWSDSIEPYQN